MAANFWQSSHCEHWLLDKSRVFRSNGGDLELFNNRNDILLLRRYFCDFIHHLGLRLGLRQRVISTAQVFFKRFYLGNSFSTHDPRLVAPTVIFVAAKVEECPINAKVLLQKLGRMEPPSLTPAGTQSTMPSPALINLSAPAIGPSANAVAAAATPPSASSLSSTPLPFLYDMDDLLEMEFAVLVGLKYDLIVFHPYRPLTQFLGDLKLNECLQMAWEVVNDTYRLDLPLLHPPYLLAIAAIYITCNFQDKEYRAWFKTLNVEQEKIVEISRELLALWDDAENYASHANQIKLHALLCKLNERNFQTLAQQARAHPASAPAGSTLAVPQARVPGAASAQKQAPFIRAAQKLQPLPPAQPAAAASALVAPATAAAAGPSTLHTSAQASQAAAMALSLAQQANKRSLAAAMQTVGTHTTEPKRPKYQR